MNFESCGLKNLLKRFLLLLMPWRHTEINKRDSKIVIMAKTYYLKSQNTYS